jgi:eukaryotic-like serine/threonine-protein kinase
VLTPPGEVRFDGNERFTLEERIGEGGMGIVYRARDREREAIVALKTLSRVSANRLLQFKREFRTLTDLSHPNVVTLYELIKHGDEWFFTMELVEGVPFTTYAWSTRDELVARQSGIRPLSSHSLTAATLDGPSLVSTPSSASDDSRTSPSGDVYPAAHDLAHADTRPASVVPVDRAPSPVRSVRRLREALYQLALGVSSIHGAGKLHCDIKPSNVLVTSEGRVVVLDFGITADIAGSDATRGEGARADKAVVGTPAYMAPEQAVLAELTPAADWYSVGVLLYETLTGRLPFQGEVLALLVAKQRGTPARPSELADNVPEDLDALCFDLLQPDPARRPTGAQILRRLSSSAIGQTRREEVDDAAFNRPPFVGRRKERRALSRALETVERGDLAAVHIRGPSGIGKSSLVDRFLADARERRETLVLRGRCYERESVPYKAFDSLVDDLSRHLVKLPLRKAQALLPPGARELAQIFPVLRAVSAIEGTRMAAALDPHEQQRRGFAALRELLRRIGTRRLLVLSLDDVHWGDTDSARLLDALVAPPDPPPLLLVATYRSDQAERSPMLGASQHLQSSSAPTKMVLDLAELVDEEATELAERLLEQAVLPASRPAGHGGRTGLAQRLARESGQNPLFLVELVRHAVDRADPEGAPLEGEPTDAPVISLDSLLASRLASLSPESRRLLEVLVIAGGPVEQRVALVAAEIDPSDWKAVASLRARRLTHSQSSGDRFLLEPVHERIRRAVLEATSEDTRRATSGRLARALEATGHADPEAVASMYRSAGETEAAARFTILAADAASEALAFMRAAELYDSARRLVPRPVPASLIAKHAQALANAGRLFEAGRAFSEAADASSGMDALDLRRRSAEELLKSGREEDGLRVLRRVLSEVGLSYPKTPFAALATLSVHRARSALRRFPRGAMRESGDPMMRARADVAFTAFIGLSLTDVIRGAAFGAQALTLALAVGDPFRVGRALAIEASMAATAGRKGAAQGARLVRAASDIAGDFRDPRTAALATLAAAYVPFFLGDWRRAERELEEAQAMMRSRCTGVAFELINSETMLLNALILSGQLRLATQRLPTVVAEAEARGDRYGMMQLTYARTVAALLADDAEYARRVSEEHVPPWTPNRYTISHWAALTSAVSVERYLGNGCAAWARFDREWGPLVDSHLMRVQTIRVFAYFERAMCALAAVSDGGPTTLIRTAERDAKRILGEDAAWATAMGNLVLGCAAASRGDRAGALGMLLRAIEGLDSADMAYISACARVRRAELLGGGAGEALRERAASYLRGEGARDVDRCARLTAPVAGEGGAS